MGNLIVVRTYSTAQYAHLDAAMLAEAGIESTIHDETMATMMPHLANAMGGIKLLVNEADGVRAMEVLGEHKTPSEPSDPDEESEESYQCPKCESPNVEITGSVLAKSMSFILRIVGLAVPVRRKRCSRCGNTWI